MGVISRRYFGKGRACGLTAVNADLGCKSTCSAILLWHIIQHFHLLTCHTLPSIIASGLGNYNVRKRFENQNFQWSLKFVIQNNYQARHRISLLLGLKLNYLNLLMKPMDRELVIKKEKNMLDTLASLF